MIKSVIAVSAQVAPRAGARIEILSWPACICCCAAPITNLPLVRWPSGYSALGYRSAGNAPEFRADASRARHRPARVLRSKWRLTELSHHGCAAARFRG
jgi:hypothetical protein